MRANGEVVFEIYNRVPGDTASNLGNAMDELMRHQPTLRSATMKAIYGLLTELENMGSDPATVCSRWLEGWDLNFLFKFSYDMLRSYHVMSRDIACTSWSSNSFTNLTCKSTNIFRSSSSKTDLTASGADNTTGDNVGEVGSQADESAAQDDAGLLLVFL